MEWTCAIVMLQEVQYEESQMSSNYMSKIGFCLATKREFTQFLLSITDLQERSVWQNIIYSYLGVLGCISFKRQHLFDMCKSSVGRVLLLVTPHKN